MSDAETLTAAVQAIEEQADRKETTENIDETVATARATLSNLNDDLEKLAEAIKTLQFYRQLLDEMFGGNEPSVVQSALDESESAVQIDQSKVIDALVKNAEGGRETRINEIQDDITEATSSVNDATDLLKERLRDYQTEWEEQIDSAKELQQIIGEQNDEFAKTVNWIEEIVTTNMWEPDRSASSIVFNWDNATKRWEKHQDLQGLDAFQQTYGLSEDAIDAIERLSSQSGLTLAEVDSSVLNELKQIDQLAESVELSI